MELLRKFWGLVPRKRFAVVIAGSGREIARYWTEKAARQVKAELNAQERFGGQRRRLYWVREL